MVKEVEHWWSWCRLNEIWLPSEPPVTAPTCHPKRHAPNCALQLSWRGKLAMKTSFLYQVLNMFISAVKLGILTWGWMETDSLLEPASSGQSKNCSFWHFHLGFILQFGRLPLGSSWEIVPHKAPKIVISTSVCYFWKHRPTFASKKKCVCFGIWPAC